MKCPIDSSILVMTERQGIEIDYCPQCRGVWLDRGELDKMIEHSGNAADSSIVAQPVVDRREYDKSPQRDDHYRQEHRYDNRDYSHKKHKKENFLGDLFDF